LDEAGVENRWMDEMKATSLAMVAQTDTGSPKLQKKPNYWHYM